MTTFLVYAPIADTDLAGQLGKPEYSYTFVRDHFRPALERLGTVVPVADPATEVDARYDEVRAGGDDCYFLCFAPPHRAPVGLRCPSTTVFAWEFDTIPDETWGGDPRTDWRFVLADHGRAIVLSEHSATAVRAAMGPEFPVRAIPTASFEAFAGTSGPHRLDLGPRSLAVTGTVIDSRDFRFTERGLESEALARRFTMAAWDGEPFDMSFTLADEARGGLVGFYLSEPWGTWSRVVDPWVILPYAVSGRVEVSIVAHGQGANADRRIRASLGTDTREFVLPARRRTVTLRFDVAEPTSVLQFRGLAADILPEVADERTMGIGLARISVRRPGPVPARIAHALRRRRASDPGADFRIEPRAERLDLSGVVYTTVFNPVDARKNWEAMIYAFCHAFRDEPDATLLLKLTHHSVTSFFANLQFYLHRVGPVKCRVVALHGFLDDDAYRDLTDLTTYYVNASTAEGLCMPLMEFMSAGVPAIAPDHTAMADYLTDEAAFVLDWSTGVSSWPHDDRMLLRARNQRVSWPSLVQAFRDSFAVARDDPARYAAMGAAARAAQERFSGTDVVAAAVADFLQPDAANPEAGSGTGPAGTGNAETGQSGGVAR